jgi:MFS family permease
MYQLDWVAQIKSGKFRSIFGSATLAVGSTVWRLGYTSFFTDVSSEMVSSILPLYFVLHLHFSPLQFGILDGIYQGAAVALLSLASGIYADRVRRQKEVATTGYALSAVSKVALLAAGNVWPAVAGVLAIDRVGKGIRTAPRDAMISLSSPRETLATAFAVHRGLDAGGAVFGPLAAYLLLRLVPGAFDLVLVASACIAFIGLGIIGLLVEKPRMDAPTRGEMPSLRLCLGLWNQARFRAILMAGGALSVATASDGFVYLVIQKNTNSTTSMIPLFAFLTALFYLLLSVPAGRLADKWGREKVFLCGYALVIVMYGILLSPELGTGAQFALVGLFGAYYAATDGVLAAMASATLNSSLRTSGLALMNTVTSVARLVSSVVFGWLWTSDNMKTPVLGFLAGLSAALFISAFFLIRRKSE